jgi:hypothetical protein
MTLQPGLLALLGGVLASQLIQGPIPASAQSSAGHSLRHPRWRRMSIA